MIDTFEERLLRELKQVVADRAAGTPAAARRSWSPARLRRPMARAGWLRVPAPRRLALGVGLAAVAVAATATVVVAACLASSAGPAYAVDRRADGHVTVTLDTSAVDPDGLAAELKRAGVPTLRWRPVASDAVCPPGEPAMRTLFVDSDTDPGIVLRSEVDVAPGQLAVLATTPAGASPALAAMWIADRRPTCVSFTPAGAGMDAALFASRRATIARHLGQKE